MTFSAGLHIVAAIVTLANPSGWPWVVGLLLADHAALVAGGLLPRSRLLGPNIIRETESPTGSRDVVLTFDDGPDPEVTPHVLDRLEAAGCTGSFFFVGAKARDHADLVAEVVRRGNRVENHTYSHPWTFAFYDPRALVREIDRAQEVLHQLTGRRPEYFRAAGRNPQRFPGTGPAAPGTLARVLDPPGIRHDRKAAGCRAPAPDSGPGTRRHPGPSRRLVGPEGQRSARGPGRPGSGAEITETPGTPWRSLALCIGERQAGFRAVYSASRSI